MKKDKKSLKQMGLNHKKLRDNLDPIKYDGYVTLKKLSEIIKDKTGVSISYSRISNFENGKKQPSINELLALKEFYNVSTDYLLGYTDCPSPNYEVINFCNVLGLTLEALQILKSIKENTNGIINKILSVNNRYFFEAMLKRINEYVELGKKGFFRAETGEKLSEAKRRYELRKGKKLESYDNNEFIVNDLNALTTEQEKRMEDMTLIRFKINSYLNKILDNICHS